MLGDTGALGVLAVVAGDSRLGELPGEDLVGGREGEVDLEVD